jgi:hypothetical protein
MTRFKHPRIHWAQVAFCDVKRIALVPRTPEARAILASSFGLEPADYNRDGGRYWITDPRDAVGAILTLDAASMFEGSGRAAEAAEEAEDIIRLFFDLDANPATF